MSSAWEGSGDDFGTQLGAGTAFEGLLTFRGSARVDGQLEGQVRADGTLILGPTAKVRARVEVDELILAGHLEGDVVARQRVVLAEGARLIGSVRTPTIRIDDGAVLDGACHTGPAALDPVPGPVADATPSAADESVPRTPEAAENTPESA